MRPLLLLCAAAIFTADCAVPSTRTQRVPHRRVDSRSSTPHRRVGSRSSTPHGAGSQPFLPSVVAFTRFNCAFPFCPTTALDVCTADEHYELGRPHVIATLIPQTDTADMDFSTTTFSSWDNSTRSHYTLAARLVGGAPLNQLFTVYIAPNGTSGALLATAEVTLPAGIAQADLTYLFVYNGSVWVATQQGALLPINPTTGVVGSAIALLPPAAGLVDTRAAAFDAQGAVFYANAVGTGGFFVHSYNLATRTVGPPVGPLPATSGTAAGPGGVREDTAVATLPVYRPAASGGGFRLMEMRTSPVEPWIWMAFMDPTTGNTTEIELPVDWYQVRYCAASREAFAPGLGH
jgi:hypothetical protein